MRIVAAIAFAAATAFTGAFVSAARADVPEEGTYVTHCRKDVTCSATIEKTGKKSWAFEWIATDRAGVKTYCRYTAKLTRGDAPHREETAYDVLKGTLSGTKDAFFVASMAGDQAWMFVDENVCEGKVPGDPIAFNGFYDLQQGDY